MNMHSSQSNMYFVPSFYKVSSLSNDWFALYNLEKSFTSNLFIHIYKYIISKALENLIGKPECIVIREMY